ncbi:hypothetical protein U8V72_18200, partial [Priestia filamentosa]|uniref:hypothetical protein n=1 Tax=Priestia filamentosa TaxID=1402861 RepID=UPI00397C7775
MDKKRKKILWISGAILVIGIALIVYLLMKSTPIPVEEKNQNINTENNVSKKESNPKDNTTDEDNEDTQGSTKQSNSETESKSEVGVASFAIESEKSKYYMDGSREKAEVKKSDYAYLLDGKPIDFFPKMPPQWEGKETQIDNIPGFYEKEPSERAVYYKQKTDFTDKQKEEVEKIKALNSTMYEAY